MPHSHIRTLPLRARQGVLQRIGKAWNAALTRRRDRMRLAKLDTHLLRDIGVTARDAEAECAKPFWKP